MRQFCDGAVETASCALNDPLNSCGVAGFSVEVDESCGDVAHDLFGSGCGVFVVSPCVAEPRGVRLSSHELERAAKHHDGFARWKVVGESVGVVEEVEVGDNAWGYEVSARAASRCATVGN